MMTMQIVDANPHRKFNWSQIDWNQIKRNVRRLQARIVEALKQGNFRKVKDLRRLLVRSFSAKLLAVKRVTTNRGTFAKLVHSDCHTIKLQSPGLHTRGLTGA